MHDQRCGWQVYENAPGEWSASNTGGDVARQPHYAHGIEPIDYMRSRFTVQEMRGFLRGNCLKYLSRYTDKGGVEDLRKAEVYLKWLIELEVNNVHSA